MTAHRLYAAVYRRVSSALQTGGTSPETQLERGMRFIAEQGFEMVGDFYDGGISGARESRPELDRLFALCRAGRVDVVLVGDLSRLSRDLRNSLNFEWELNRLGVRVVDVDNPRAGELERNLRYVIAQEYRRATRVNTMRGRQRAAEMGLWVGGPPPFGLRSVNVEGTRHKRLELDEGPAETVRIATRLIVDEGLSTYRAAERLNAMGRLTPRGRRWTHNSLRRVLSGRYLKGEWVFSSGRPYVAKGDGPPDARRRRAEGSPVPYPNMPRVLEPERWDALQRVLSATSVVPKATQRVHPLTGRVVGVCGAPFHGVAASDERNPIYRCRNRKPELRDAQCADRRVNALDLEWAVWHAVCEVITQPGKLEALAARYLAGSPNRGASQAGEAKDLASKITRLERQLADAYEAGLTNGLDAKALKAATARMQADLDAARRAKAQFDQWRAQAESGVEHVRQLKQLAKRMAKALRDPAPELMRRVFAELDIRVDVLEHATRQQPLRVRVSGNVIWEGLAERLEDGDEPNPPSVTPRTESARTSGVVP